MSEQEAIPAATIIVMRDGAGAPEILMVERAAAMSFAGGALVFPGGRVDPGDHNVAATLGHGDADDMAARIGGIRETLEEAGVAVGVDVAPDAISELRRRLYAGEPMTALLAEFGGVLRVEDLVPFARWVPRNVQHKVFDTRFYLARAPRDAMPIVDGNENVRVFWASARSVLDSAHRGETRIIFPTRCNLERLALFASFEEAVANVRAHPPRTISPWVEEREDGRHLCIPLDLGYPMTSQLLSAAIRA